MTLQQAFEFSSHRSSLRNELEEFEEFGARTVVEDRGGVPVFHNEFWTSRQRQANRLHEISYRACFKPQLPRFFIERLTEIGDVVYDPFMGRGTTPLEAALLGRQPLGNDINPLSVALCEPRMAPPSLVDVQAKLEMIPWERFSKATREDLLVFYHPETLAQIEGLRAWFLERQAEGRLDNTDKWIRMVAVNRLTGHSSGFFSVYTLPPNQAVKPERQRKINEKRQQSPPLRDVRSIILKKSRNLLSSDAHPDVTGTFSSVASDETPHIADASVALTVTSPPFLDIVDYESDNWLRGWFIGLDTSAIKIASHRKVEDWQSFTRSTLAEISRVTKVGGHIAYEVGEVRNGSVQLEDVVLTASAGLPLEPVGIMINTQDFTKTANCWGVSNNTAGTNTNRIVVFRKAKYD